MSLFYCPVCGQLYRADSVKLSAFCVRCGMPTPKKASEYQERAYEAQRHDLLKHRTF